MKQLEQAGQRWKSVWRLLTGIMVAGSLSGCGGGGGSSQSLQSAAVPQHSTVAVITPAVAPAASASSGCSVNSFVPNFATETDPATNLPNQLFHWTAFPAHVFFVPGSFLTPNRKAQTLAGFGWWAQATGSAVQYQEVGTAAAANIVVQYETRGDTNYGAITEYQTDDKRQLANATITFNMTYLANTADITPVAAHEFGHALGIGGHSTDSNDVMSSSPEVYTRVSLSNRDVNTLKTAYCGLPDTLASPGSAASDIAKGAKQTIIVRCGLGVH